MLNQRFKLLLMLASFAGITVSFPALAEVRSMSIERNRVIGGETLSQVSLRCGSDSNPRFMIKPAEQLAQWCSVEVKGLCNRSKYRLAKKLCKYNAKGFRSLAKKSQEKFQEAAVVNQSSEQEGNEQINEETEIDQVEGVSDRIADLRREQILIEEQRIQIEQRRLELVNLEIQVKKGLLTASGTGD